MFDGSMGWGAELQNLVRVAVALPPVRSVRPTELQEVVGISEVIYKKVGQQEAAHLLCPSLGSNVGSFRGMS